MRRVRYAVAASLDGYIAGPNGEADWIMMDADIDFHGLFNEFDTVLIGRRTFEVMLRSGNGAMPGMEMFVFSRTLRQQDHPGVTVVADKAAETLAELRSKPGKDTWLLGGGLLFRSLADAGLVNTIEVSMIPILLGEGIPMFPGPTERAKLRLTGHRVYESGIVRLEYSLQ